LLGGALNGTICGQELVDPYNPETWHDFFLAVAGAAAALTGLLFVSLSLHVRYIAASTNHRNLARGSLIGLVQVVVLSLVVLVRQPPAWTGFELALVNLFYILSFGTFQVLVFRRLNWKVPTISLLRSSFAYLLSIAGLVGGINIYTHTGAGLYAVAFQVIAIIVWNLRNAWSLLMTVADEDLAREASGEAPVEEVVPL
jgi:hypothetical protein